MKTFLIAIILFLSMSVIIAINQRYVNDVANSLQAIVSQLTDPSDSQCNEHVNDLSLYWGKHLNIISLSVCSQDLNKITDCISQLKASASTEEPVDFEIAKQLLLNAIEKMRRLELVTLDNIL